MPQRVSKDGSYRIDLIFPEIGRIWLASGAQTKAEHGKRVAMLRELYDNGQWDVLRDLKDHRFGIRQLYAYYKANRVGQLGAEVVLRQPLVAAVEAWLEVSAKAAATRKRYEVSWKSFQRAKVLPADAIIRDLERVSWTDLQGTWLGGPYDWRHLRGFVSRFLSAVLRDKWHTFRRSIMENFPAGPEPEGRVPDLTVEAFWKVQSFMPEHTAACPVAIVATAMRIGELVACTEENLLPLTTSVLIPGHQIQDGSFKSEQATQPVDAALWPWVVQAIPVTVSQWTIRDHWRDACKKAGVGNVTLHDLRHCYGQWLVNAGRSEEAVQRGLRHKTPAQTRRYVKQRDRMQNAEQLADILLARTHSQPRSRKKSGGRKGA